MSKIMYIIKFRLKTENASVNNKHLFNYTELCLIFSYLFFPTSTNVVITFSLEHVNGWYANLLHSNNEFIFTDL